TGVQIKLDLVVAAGEGPEARRPGSDIETRIPGGVDAVLYRRLDAAERDAAEAVVGGQRHVAGDRRRALRHRRGRGQHAPADRGRANAKLDKSLHGVVLCSVNSRTPQNAFPPVRKGTLAPAKKPPCGDPPA